VELILWRHAEAGEAAVDSERSLTSNGIKQAKRMAAWLRPRLPESVVVLASPARRAQQTVQALTRNYKTIKALGTATTPEDVLVAAGWPGNDNAVVLVGHQPILGQLAALLVTGNKARWNVEPGAIVWVAHTEVGSTHVYLRVAISPDLL
jgi:phosphohistidine phosphatase